MMQRVFVCLRVHAVPQPGISSHCELLRYLPVGPRDAHVRRSPSVCMRMRVIV